MFGVWQHFEIKQQRGDNFILIVMVCGYSHMRGTPSSGGLGCGGRTCGHARSSPGTAGSCGSAGTGSGTRWTTPDGTHHTAPGGTLQRTYNTHTLSFVDTIMDAKTHCSSDTTLCCRYIKKAILPSDVCYTAANNIYNIKRAATGSFVHLFNLFRA